MCPLCIASGKSSYMHSGPRQNPFTFDSLLPMLRRERQLDDVVERNGSVLPAMKGRCISSGTRRCDLRSVWVYSNLICSQRPICMSCPYVTLKQLLYNVIDFARVLCGEDLITEWAHHSLRLFFPTPFTIILPPFSQVTVTADFSSFLLCQSVTTAALPTLHLPFFPN